MQKSQRRKILVYLLIPIALFIIICCGNAKLAAQVIPPHTALLQVADSLYQLQQWGQAKEKYRQYLKDSAHQPMSWQRLGYCNHHLGLYKEAISNYEKALSLNPFQQLKFAIEVRVARSYAQLKNGKAALQWLEKAVQSGYQDVNEIDRISDFDAIKGSKEFKDLYKRIYNKAYPCSADAKSKEFDFWVGEWDVYQNGTNVLVGYSRVEKISGECALLENWTALAGTGTGKSLNYYDAVANSWEQDWIGSTGGPQRYVNGVYKDSAMRFTYENVTNGKKTTGNFIFYNLGPDKVRQYQDSSDDGGKTFTVMYDFLYVRKK